MQRTGIYDDRDLELRRERPLAAHPEGETIWQPQPPAVDLWSVCDKLVAILEAPAASHETVEVAFTRKEREIGSLFSQLSVPECRALHARLANPQPADEVAVTFGRLVIARRTRLLAFLADVRRRQAIAGGRRRG